MSLRHTLRSLICQFRMTPNYPLGDLVRWVEEFGPPRDELLYELDELQAQLDVEAEALRRHGKGDTSHLLQQQYWSFYCSQVRSYYRTLYKHPELTSYLEPLLCER